jgi:hypothetical protein
MPNASSIRLIADLHEAFAFLFADGVDSQNRGIGVRSDHGDRVTGL